MSYVRRTLARGDTLLRPGGRRRRCRRCSAPVYFARNEYDESDWIRFDDPDYYREHQCFARKQATGTEGVSVYDVHEAIQSLRREVEELRSKVAYQYVESPLITRPGTARSATKSDPIADYHDVEPPAANDHVVYDEPPGATESSLTGLQAVLLRAGTGKPVELDEDHYAGPVVITQTCEITSTRGNTVIEVQHGPAIIIRGCSVTLHRLTVRSEFGPAIIVESTPGRSAVCHLTSSTVVADTHAVHVGPESRLVMRDSYVESEKEDAVRLGHSSRCVIGNSLITSASADGIRGDLRVTLDITDSSVSDCGGSGIQLGRGAMVWTGGRRGVDLSGNAGCGLALADGSKATLKATKLEDNGAYGIFSPASQLTLEVCSFRNNQLGDRR